MSGPERIDINSASADEIDAVLTLQGHGCEIVRTVAFQRWIMAASISAALAKGCREMLIVRWSRAGVGGEEHCRVR